MYIFQSEQLIELRFWLKITSLIFKSPDLNPLDGLSCEVQYWDAIYAKTNRERRAGECLASIWNDLPQEFTDKKILWFRKRLRFCVAAAGRHFGHSV